MSSRLPFGTVDWGRFARGAYQVMKPGGELSLNIWVTEGRDNISSVIDAFQAAGFKNVTKIGEGVGTIITGKK